MADPMPWSIFFPPPPTLQWIRNEDIITMQQEPGACEPDEIQFVLGSSNPQLTWWKQLRIVGDGERLVLGSSEFQDEVRRGAIIQLPIAQLSGKSMQLCKAKMFGVHTCMYDLAFNTAPRGLLVSGVRLSFDWFRDNGP
jgi:hypothetical protein